MSAKVTVVGEGDGKRWVVYCPGCKSHHPYDSRWTFNGSFEAPTFTPSFMCNQQSAAHCCHSFVTDGKIQFLSDCAHALAGQTVELPDIEETWPATPESDAPCTCKSLSCPLHHEEGRLT